MTNHDHCLHHGGGFEEPTAFTKGGVESEAGRSPALPDDDSTSCASTLVITINCDDTTTTKTSCSKTTTTPLPLHLPKITPRDNTIRRALVTLTIMAGAYYLIRRWYQAIVTQAYLSLPFLIAETWLYLYVILDSYTSWTPAKRTGRDLREVLPDPQSWPTVDVFIPCYNEPVAVVEGTVVAALRLAYPRDKLNVYVLDDNSSSETEAMVRRLQRVYMPFPQPSSSSSSSSSSNLHYIARVKLPGVPHHAKAGNMNHALLQGFSRGQFVVVFDCDMNCMPQFLLRTLPHFYSPSSSSSSSSSSKEGPVLDTNLAYVQTPQDFYNVADRDPLSQRQHFFYRWTLACWEGRGMSLCCGTNVVFSRGALEAIGGWGTLSVTEDVLTSYLLNAAGYQGCYLDEPLAFGLCPADVKDFCQQRVRWMVGSLQVLYYDNPLFKPGLTWGQKAYYYWVFANDLQCVPRLVVLLMPLVFLYSPHLVLVNMTVYQWLQIFIPYYLLIQLVLLWVLWRADIRWHYYGKVQQEGVYLTFLQLKALLKVFVRVPTHFLPTPKDGSALSSTRDNLLPLTPNLLFLLASLLALLIWIAQGPDIVGRGPTGQVVASWCINLLALLVNAWNMAVPIRDAISGFGEENKRSFADFCRTKAGRLIVPIMDEEEEEEGGGGGMKKNVTWPLFS